LLNEPLLLIKSAPLKTMPKLAYIIWKKLV